MIGRFDFSLGLREKIWVVSKDDAQRLSTYEACYRNLSPLCWDL